MIQQYTSIFAAVLLIVAGLISCDRGEVREIHSFESIHHSAPVLADTSDSGKVIKTDQEWRDQLSREEYRILRRGGTELPFVNEYNGVYEDGIYVCAACGNPLFDSETKYKSRSGWPSFWEPIRQSAVAEREDNSFFMTRTEIICNRCDSHLGHVFDDGPEPTGLRYCMNSAAMNLVER